MVGASGWEEGEIPACCLVEIVSVWEGGKVLEMDGGDALHKNVLNTIQMYAGWLKRQISCYVYFNTNFMLLLFLFWLHWVFAATSGVFSLTVVRDLSCPTACGILVP